jgi:glycosyltransferase involved in cell wall biosynthesis
VATRLVDFDLERPAALPDAPAGYSAVRVLVRLGRMPLGTFELAAGSALEAEDALAAALAETGGAAWAELLARSRHEPHSERSNGNGNGNGHGALTPISVVVCTRNRPRDLQGCLAALAAQRYPLYEVVVVDNALGGCPETRKLAERSGARYVLESSPGLDRARNRGIAESRSPIVAFTDDDARPDPDWLGVLAAAFATPGVDAVTGLILPAELETKAQKLFEDAYGGMAKGYAQVLHSRRGRSMRYRPWVFGAGCNMAFRREALGRIGGFDPVLDAGTPAGGGGDLDALQRVLETDGAVLYRPDALVRHVHRRTVRLLRRQLADNGRAAAAVLCRAFGRARGLDRARVVHDGLAFVFAWYVKLVRREAMPLRLLLAETLGFLLGPAFLAISRARARRLNGGDA